MIRVAIVDDHPAVRAGLEAVLDGVFDIEPVGSADGLAKVKPLLYRTRPDVILMDYHLLDEDGLIACRHIKKDIPAPRILLYTAYASSALALPASLAGADGVLNKSVPSQELCEAIRRVASGERVGPLVTDDLIAQARRGLHGQDLRILDHLLAGTPADEICGELGIDSLALDEATDGLIVTLRIDVPTINA